MLLEWMDQYFVISVVSGQHLLLEMILSKYQDTVLCDPMGQSHVGDTMTAMYHQD